MKRTNLFLSRYAHFFKQRSVVACYHSLRMMPVYIPATLLPIVNKFEGGADSQGLLSFVDLENQETFFRAVDALENAKVLIQDPAEDEKAIDYFMDLLGKPYPHLAYFILTERCNFRCNYCFVKNNNPLGNMTKEVALKGLDFFCRLIAKDPEQFDLEKTIVFYGGEPLLNWSVFETLLSKIKDYIKSGKLPQETTLNLVTNGSLLNRKIARILRDHNVQISISIDGDDSATNSSRIYANGESVYQDIKRGFQICKEAGMDIGASCTLSEASIHNFDTTLRVLLDECEVTNLGLNLMISGEEKMNNGYNERAAKFILDAFQVFRKRGVYEDRIMRKANAFIERTVWPFDCGATGGNQIVIAPDGDVGVCHGFVGKKKYFPTSVYDNDFDISKDKDFKEWSMRSPLNMPECQDCFALGICGGGCPYQSELETGSIWELDKRFCVHAKMTLEWLIWDLFRQTQIS
ncbi:MAG: SPASM domain-containing protein [Patescibacteria group bacterium]|nr:SPASM domain-containing protein [Patescibacteria group bacterium]